MIRLCRCAIVTVSLVVGLRAAAAMPEETAALLDRAAERSDLQLEGGPPMRLHAKVRTENEAGKPIEGTYLLLWESPRTWRVEVAWPGYSEAIGRQGAKRWRWRSQDYAPDPAGWVRQSLDLAGKLRREPSWNAERRRRKTIEGRAMDCVRIRPDRWTSRNLCFDPGTGDPLRSDTDSGNDLRATLTYDGWTEVEGKRFPGRLRYVYGNRLRVDAEVTELEPLRTVDPAWFAPPDGATVLDPCETYVPPHALGDARESPGPPPLWAGKAEAVIHLVVGPTGNVVRARVVRAVPPEFGPRLAKAYERVRFAPATCDGRPVEDETSVRQTIRSTVAGR